MLNIDGRKIALDQEPYIVAELSANHNGSIERAKATIKAAKDSGAHAIKLETYTADPITIDWGKADFIVKMTCGMGTSFTICIKKHRVNLPF